MTVLMKQLLAIVLVTLVVTIMLVQVYQLL